MFRGKNLKADTMPTINEKASGLKDKLLYNTYFLVVRRSACTPTLCVGVHPFLILNIKTIVLIDISLSHRPYLFPGRDHNLDVVKNWAYANDDWSAVYDSAKEGTRDKCTQKNIHRHIVIHKYMNLCIKKTTYKY